MSRYEYKVVPAPTKGLKGKGIKGAEARFSHAIQELMNGLSGYGWEYQRAETLPSIERSGLTSSTTEWRNILVFRRLREHDAELFAPELLPPPETAAQESAKPVAPTQDDPVRVDAELPAKDSKAGADTAVKSIDSEWDNGVEDTSDVDGIGATLETLVATRKSAKPDG